MKIIEQRQYSMAAELLVRAKLLLLGEYPLSFDVDNDADICLDDGTKIQVKSALLTKNQYHPKYLNWCFSLKKGHNQKIINPESINYLICVGFENLNLNPKIWIIPSQNLFPKFPQNIHIIQNKNSKYEAFLDAWYLIRKRGE